MSLYDRVLARPGGERALAVARLKRTILSTLHQAFKMSGIASQSDLARRLRVRRSAVNQVLNGDGNLRISTLAEYLHEMGYELNVTLARSGEPRAAALEGRPVQTISGASSISASPAFAWVVSAPIIANTFVVSTSTFVNQFYGSLSLGSEFCSGEPKTRAFVFRSWNLASAGDIIAREAMQSMAPSSQIRIEETRGAQT